MRSALLIVFAVLFALTSFAQKPDFTGLWVLNTMESKLQTPASPLTSTFLVVHRDDNWHMQQTRFYRNSKPNTVQFDRVIGAEPVTTQDEDHTIRTRMYWDGDSVVLAQQITGPDNEHGINQVVYSLSSDRKQLTALEREESLSGKYTNKWVFDRLPMPVLIDRLPGTGLTDMAVAKLKRIIERDHGDCDPKDGKLEIDYGLFDLGNLGPGVIVRSQRSCDCGATGNCIIYLYQRHGAAFHELLFRNDASPWGWPYGTVTSTSGYLFFVASSHMSAGVSQISFYEFVNGLFTSVGSECLKSAGEPGNGNNASRPEKSKIESCSAPS